MASYSCVCDPEYTGRFCQIHTPLDINDCDPNPCQNEAVCIVSALYNHIDNRAAITKFFLLILVQDGFNNYTCVCKLGFSSRNCETNVDDCKPNPCKHGGICQVSLMTITKFSS